MGPCETTEGEHSWKPWCEAHLDYATHVATDGDKPVCEEYAKRHGCNCGHYPDRSGESDLLKALRALSGALGDAYAVSSDTIECRALYVVQEAVDRVINEIKES